MKRFCTNCGKELGDQEVFCTNCGTKSELPQSAASGSKGISVGGISVGGVSVKNMAESNNGVIKIGIIVASVLVILAALIPYAKISMFGQSLSISLMGVEGEMGDGIIYIALGILAIVFAFMNKKIPVLVVGIVAFLMCCYEMISMNSLYEEMGMFAGMITKGPGFYLMIVATVGLLALSILNFVMKGSAKA